MPKYIDCEALKQTLLEKDFYPAIVKNVIENVPAADVVEVVRCKDCKWFNEIGCAISIVDDSDNPKEDDFCSFGERKGDSNE